jgi:hypothetical protein
VLGTFREVQCDPFRSAPQSPRLAPWHRALFLLAGLMLLVPAGTFDGALYSDIAGALLGAALVAIEWANRRASPASL